MYNKCSKCGKLIEKGDETRLIPDPKGGVQVLCFPCYSVMFGNRE